MTQNTAAPAPAIQKRGNEAMPTAVYCWNILSSRPVGIIIRLNAKVRKIMYQ